MGFMDFLCAASSPDVKMYDGSPEPHECDYDKNPTNLYQAIENQAWVPVLEFFDTGKWQDGGIFGAKPDPDSPEIQARTWVTRFEKDGSVRWSQLPLHAALIFGAPPKIVSTLVKLFPQGIRCTDDQHMLPVHLAIKFGSEDNVMRFLIESFPESLFTKDIRGRYPTKIEGPRQDRTKIIDEIISVTTKTVAKKHSMQVSEEMKELKEELEYQKKLHGELDASNQEFESKFAAAKNEVALLRNEIKRMEAKMVRVHRDPEGTPSVVMCQKESVVREPSAVQNREVREPSTVQKSKLRQPGATQKRTEQRNVKSFNSNADENTRREQPESFSKTAASKTSAAVSKSTGRPSPMPESIHIRTDAGRDRKIAHKKAPAGKTGAKNGRDESEKEVAILKRMAAKVVGARSSSKTSYNSIREVGVDSRARE